MKRVPLNREAATADQIRCLAAISDLFGGDHRIRSTVFQCGTGIEILRHGEFATFDGDELTRMVLLAHRDCVRFAISGGGFGRVSITVHPRQQGDANAMSLFERHPTLGDLELKAGEMRIDQETEEAEEEAGAT